MKQILLNSAKISINLKRNFLIPLLFSMFANFAIAQTSGIYESYAILSINGGSDTFYDLQAATGNPDFNGANLGSFVYGLETLVFKGGQNKTYKNSGCNINSSIINYRIYLSGSPLGSYNNINESFLSDDGGGNQTWEGLSGSANLIAGLSPGTYTIEVYSQAGYDGCGTGTHFSSNGGSNYLATFTVVKAESTASITGSDIFTYNTLAQGPNTSVVTGSTGEVTYSYEGVSETSYSASATPPTNVGSYIVIATVAADDNYNGASSLATPFTIGASTNIPDENFEQALIDKGIDSGALDHYVLTSNISNITNLNVSYKSISDLTGIQDFVGLEILDCHDNSLTSLDISSLTNLKELNCYFNYLTSLDVSKVKLLEYMDCGDNMLTSLDVTGLTSLSYLYTGYNNLSTLNLTNLMASANMYCYDNPQLNCIIADDPAEAAANANWQKDAFSTYSKSNPTAKTGNVTGDTSVCMGSTSGLLTLNDAVGTIARWESAVSPFTTWTNISNTSNTYISGVLMETTQFRAITESNCQTYASTPATVTIETTTWTGTWSNGTPTAAKTAIISANFTADADLTACSLIVNNDAIVTIPSGNNIIVTGAVTVTAPATLTLSNNSNLIQVNNVANTGAITVNRNSSLLKRLDYTLWSSPVSGAQTLADFSPLTSQDPSRFYSFDPTNNIGGVNGAFSAITTPTSTTFAAGAGYLIRMPNTADAVTPTAYAGQFTGLPNNGDVSVALIDGLAVGLRYNLVGNPYPSTVNMTQFVSDNSSNIQSTLYFWRKTNGVGTAYCTWAPAASPTTGTFVSNGNTQSIDPLGVLQTGQGFFVEAKSGATSLTFSNSQRVADNAGQFFKTKQVVDAGRVWLNATNTSGDFSQMALTYSSQATQGVDIYDGKYINDSKFALTSNINNVEYAIQSRPAFDVSDVVALNFKTATSGDYTIAIDHVDGLFATDQDIYLVDSKTGAETNLKTSSYNFTADSGADNTRFTLKYQKTLKVDAATFNDNSVKVYINDGILHVNSGALAIANIKIFDIQGRLIKEQTNIKATTATISNLRASNQVLIVQVRGEDNSEVTKKVMN